MGAGDKGQHDYIKPCASARREEVAVLSAGIAMMPHLRKKGCKAAFGPIELQKDWGSAHGIRTGYQQAYRHTGGGLGAGRRPRPPRPVRPAPGRTSDADCGALPNLGHAAARQLHRPYLGDDLPRPGVDVVLRGSDDRRIRTDQLRQESRCSGATDLCRARSGWRDDPCRRDRAANKLRAYYRSESSVRSRP